MISTQCVLSLVRDSHRSLVPAGAMGSEKEQPLKNGWMKMLLATAALDISLLKENNLIHL